ncbi:hypothetical protein L7F22_008584 [Adiantum nelumboides]|nr:hypothetical protein [Adiantum nelumboides]
MPSVVPSFIIFVSIFIFIFFVVEDTFHSSAILIPAQVRCRGLWPSTPPLFASAEQVQQRRLRPCAKMGPGSFRHGRPLLMLLCRLSHDRLLVSGLQAEPPTASPLLSCNRGGQGRAGLRPLASLSLLGLLCLGAQVTGRADPLVLSSGHGQGYARWAATGSHSHPPSAFLHMDRQLGSAPAPGCACARAAPQLRADILSTTLPHNSAACSTSALQDYARVNVAHLTSARAALLCPHATLTCNLA